MVIVVDSKLISYNVSYNPSRSLIDVFEVVQNICEDLEYERKDKVTKIIFVFDFEKSDYRLDLWPDYKAGRVYTAMPEDFQDNYRRRLPALARALGIDILGVSGVEADDLAGILISQYKGSEDIVCLTGDRDWIQLAIEFDHVSIYDPKQLKFLKSELCTTVDEFLVEKVIKGDSSDNIKGLKFCGKVCFEKFVKGLDDRPMKEQFLQLADSSDKFDIYSDYSSFGIDTFDKMYDFNMQLGRIMDDISLLTDEQRGHYKAMVSEFRDDGRLDTAGIQRMAGVISGTRVGIFGDPLVIPDHQLEFYKKLKDG